MGYSRRQLEYFGEPLGESVTRLKPGGRIYGGGDGGAPSSSSQSTTTIPDYAKPYVERMLGKTEALGRSPYQSYGGERISGFTSMQQQAYQGIANLGPASQLGVATQMAGLAGQRASGLSYDPTAFKNQYRRPAAYQTGNFGVDNVTADKLQQFQYAFAPTEFANQYQGPDAYQAGTFGVDKIDPEKLREYQMAAAERVSAPQAFTGSAVQEYMNPYMQNVVDVQKREAQRQADLSASQRAGQAAQVGAFGGSRMGLENAMANRETQRLMSDIQSTGSSAAYQQAAAQFNAQQQAQMRAEMANQAAGLTVGQQNLAAQLGVQQLGMQAQLANQAAAQQAQQLQEASRQYGYGQQMTAAQQRAQFGLSAQQAAEQSRQYVGGQNLAAQLGVQQLGAQQSMQAQLANQAAAQQAQQMQEASRQYGYGQQMTGAQLAAQYGLSAQQAAEQSRQFGAQYGLQGIQQQIAASRALGQLGQTQFGQQKDILQAQANAGAQQQALEQKRLDQQYADFAAQRQHPYTQLAFMSDMLRGLPLSQYAQTMYEAPPSLASQYGGLALAGYGMSRPTGNKKGGHIKESKAPAGLSELLLYDMENS